MYAAEKLYSFTRKQEREILRKPKKRTAAENTEVLNAIYKWLDVEKVSEDAAKNREATQSK